MFSEIPPRIPVPARADFSLARLRALRTIWIFISIYVLIRKNLSQIFKVFLVRTKKTCLFDILRFERISPGV